MSLISGVGFLLGAAILGSGVLGASLHPVFFLLSGLLCGILGLFVAALHDLALPRAEVEWQAAEGQKTVKDLFAFVNASSTARPDTPVYAHGGGRLGPCDSVYVCILDGKRVLVIGRKGE
jgi:hypothetical protein